MTGGEQIIIIILSMYFLTEDIFHFQAQEICRRLLKSYNNNLKGILSLQLKEVAYLVKVECAARNNFLCVYHLVLLLFPLIKI